MSLSGHQCDNKESGIAVSLGIADIPTHWVGNLVITKTENSTSYNIFSTKIYGCNPGYGSKENWQLSKSTKEFKIHTVKDFTIKETVKRAL